MALTEIQTEILEGSMLGDGHLSIGGRAINPRLRINRRLPDAIYAEWMRDIFIEYCTERSLSRSSVFHKIRGKAYEKISLVTKRSQDFAEAYGRWYPNDQKTLPENVHLTPMSVAVWLADDGCIYLKKKRGMSSGLELSFATAGFGKSGTERLAGLLERRYGPGFNVYGGYERATHYKIMASTRPARRVFDDIDSVFPPLDRKSSIWRERGDIQRVLPLCQYCGKDGVFRNGWYVYGSTKFQRMECNKCKSKWEWKA